MQSYMKTSKKQRKSRAPSAPNTVVQQRQNPTSDYGYGKVGNTYRSVHVGPLTGISLVSPDTLTTAITREISIGFQPSTEMAKIFDYYKIISVNIHIMGTGDITKLPIAVCFDASGAVPALAGFAQVVSYTNSKTFQLSETHPVAKYRIDRPTHADDDGETLTTDPMVTVADWSCGGLYLSPSYDSAVGRQSTGC